MPLDIPQPMLPPTSLLVLIGVVLLLFVAIVVCKYRENKSDFNHHKYVELKDDNRHLQPNNNNSNNNNDSNNYDIEMTYNNSNNNTNGATNNSNANGLNLQGRNSNGTKNKP